MTTRKENHLIIPNSAFNSSLDRSKGLNVDELYLYSWLYRRRLPFDDMWITETFIEHIHQFCEVKFASGDESRNKRVIRDLLISLQEKEYIYNHHPDSSLDIKLKNIKPLYIEFLYADKKGFNGNITYSIFDKFENALEFFIYAYIDKFGDKGHTISYYDWERVARKSETTIKKTIKKMNTYEYKNKPRIWKFSGDYYVNEFGEARQNENTYYTRPSDDVIKKWNGFYAKDESKEKELAFGWKGKRDQVGLGNGKDAWGGSVDDVF